MCLGQNNGIEHATDTLSLSFFEDSPEPTHLIDAKTLSIAGIEIWLLKHQKTMSLNLNCSQKFL